MSTSKMAQVAKSASTKVVAPRESLHPTVEVKHADGKTTVQDAKQVALSHIKIPLDVKWSPATLVPSNLFSGSGSFADVKIENFRGVLHDLTLEIKLAETGGANNVAICPAPMMIDRIEFYANAGSDLVQTIYGDCINYNSALLTTEQLTSIGIVANYNTGYAPLGPIPAGGSATYFVPLTGNMFQQMNGLWLPALSSYILCRVYGKSSVESGTGTLACTNLFLHGEVSQLSPYDEAAEDSKYRNNIVSKPFLDNLRHQNPTTYTSGTQSQQILSAYSGDALQFIGGFQANNQVATGGNFRNYQSIGPNGLLELLDSSGQNIIGGSALNYNQVRYIEFSKKFPGTLMQTFPLVWMGFGDPAMGILHGVREGFMHFDTKDQFRITPDSTFASGAYMFSLYGYFWRHLEVSNGRISVFKN